MTTDYVKTYTLDDGTPEERDRLAGLEAAWDDHSHAALIRAGVRPGAHVLMVAGGGGSLVRWVAEQVGPTGRVLATDIAPRFLEPLAEEFDHVEVREHNVVTEDLPTEEFDVVHTRLLVAWLPERRDVIRKFIGALRPGGTLLIEDFDAGSLGAAYPTEETGRIVMANASYLFSIGYDPFTGRRLPGWFREEGLEDVDARGIVHSLRGSATTLPEWYISTFERHRPAMLADGLLSEEEFDHMIARYRDPEYDGLVHTMMSVWGRKPA